MRYRYPMIYGAVMSMYRKSVSGRERAILLIKKDQT